MWWLLGSASVERGAAPRPRPRRLERRRGLQDREIREAATDDLEPDGQPGGREAGRHRRRRLAGEVERIAERGPADPIPRVLRPVLRVQPANRERGYRQGRRQEQIVLLEERPYRVPVRELLAARLDVLDHAVLKPVLDARDEPRVHAVAPLREILGVITGLVGAPQTADQVVRVGEAGLHLFDDAAELVERADRVPDRRGDLGVDGKAAQVGAERDPEPGDARVELTDV